MKVADTFIFLGGLVVQAVGWIIGGIMDLNDATNGLVGYILAAVVAWKLLNTTFLASPIGMIIALAAAIALLVDDFLVWQEGGESLIPWENWLKEINMVKDAIAAFGAWLQPYADMLFGLFDKLQNLGSFIGMAASDLMAPSPAQGAGMTGGGANVNQQTTINVNGGDPAATGRAIAGEQSRVNGDMARNMKGAIK